MSHWYTLDADNNPVPCGMWEANTMMGNRARCCVGDDYVGPVRISTVFLALDHRYGEGPPLVFETMTFGGTERTDAWQRRYPTWAEALAGHAEAVRAIRLAVGG